MKERKKSRMDSHGLMRHYNPQGDKELNKDGSELWIFRNMGFSIAVQFGLGKSLSRDVDKGRATMKESGCWRGEREEKQ